MIANITALDELVQHVGEFPIRDRQVVKIQREMRAAVTAALTSGQTIETDLVKRYQATLRRYFVEFQKEAVAHVREIDRRLEKLAQLQFNATAERGVAARRVDVTKSVLARFESL